MQVKDQRAVLEIQDSGPGLSAALQARLFQPFSAGDTRSGSGLGLTIAREIVLALNGTIELKNQVAGSTGGGLVATISLPVAGV
jgi:two-component system sensor histidine kinase TctE